MGALDAAQRAVEDELPLNESGSLDSLLLLILPIYEDRFDRFLLSILSSPLSLSLSLSELNKSLLDRTSNCPGAMDEMVVLA